MEFKAFLIDSIVFSAWSFSDNICMKVSSTNLAYIRGSIFIAFSFLSIGHSRRYTVKEAKESEYEAPVGIPTIWRKKVFKSPCCMYILRPGVLRTALKQPQVRVLAYQYAVLTFREKFGGRGSGPG